MAKCLSCGRECDVAEVAIAFIEVDGVVCRECDAKDCECDCVECVCGAKADA